MPANRQLHSSVDSQGVLRRNRRPRRRATTAPFVAPPMVPDVESRNGPGASIMAPESGLRRDDNTCCEGIVSNALKHNSEELLLSIENSSMSIFAPVGEPAGVATDLEVRGWPADWRRASAIRFIFTARSRMFVFWDLPLFQGVRTLRLGVVIHSHKCDPGGGSFELHDGIITKRTLSKC